MTVGSVTPYTDSGEIEVSCIKGPKIHKQGSKNSNVEKNVD
jgi:hypothetical protein